jgi:1,4-dihydroxy-2-naphthoyl-CoA hydrolase
MRSKSWEEARRREHPLPPREKTLKPYAGLEGDSKNTEQGFDPALLFWTRGEPDMAIDPLPFSDLLGIELRSVSPERVEAELKVREDLCTRPAVLHGGALMALADTAGAIATVQNLPEGTWTTTIESKTNFFAAIPVGDVARAECTPLHRGRTTMVWQTRITRGDGRLAAVVTQTQLVTQARG